MPAVFTVGDVVYNYSRMMAEILTCQTCPTTFITHITTGFGAVLSQKDDVEFCPGCLEIIHQLEIRDESGGKTH